MKPSCKFLIFFCKCSAWKYKHLLESIALPLFSTAVSKADVVNTSTSGSIVGSESSFAFFSGGSRTEYHKI